MHISLQLKIIFVFSWLKTQAQTAMFWKHIFCSTTAELLCLALLTLNFYKEMGWRVRNIPRISLCACRKKSSSKIIYSVDNLSGFKSAPICPKSAHNCFPKTRPNFSQNKQFLEDISEEMTTKIFYCILLIIAWNSWVFCLLIITIFPKKTFFNANLKL